VPELRARNCDHPATVALGQLRGTVGRGGVKDDDLARLQGLRLQARPEFLPGAGGVEGGDTDGEDHELKLPTDRKLSRLAFLV